MVTKTENEAQARIWYAEEGNTLGCLAPVKDDSCPGVIEALPCSHDGVRIPWRFDMESESNSHFDSKRVRRFEESFDARYSIYYRGHVRDEAGHRNSLLHRGAITMQQQRSAVRQVIFVRSRSPSHLRHRRINV